jgi:hypothetical protein
MITAIIAITNGAESAIAKAHTTEQLADITKALETAEIDFEIQYITEAE